MLDDPGTRGLRWTLIPPAVLAAAASIAAWLGWIDPAAVPGLGFSGFDKVAHAVLFGMLAFGTHFAVRGATILRDRMPLAVALPSLVAIVDEGAQRFAPHRTADPWDLACGGLGIAVGWALAHAVAHHRRRALAQTPLA